MARKRRPANRRQGVAAICIVVALVLALSFLPGARGLPIWLGRAQRVALGDLAWLIPLVLFLGGAALAVAGEHARMRRRGVGVLLALLVALAVYHLRIPRGSEVDVGLAGSGAGIVGAAMVVALRSLFGEIGAWLLIGLGALASIALWQEISFAVFVRLLWRALVMIGRFTATGLVRGILLLAEMLRAAGGRLLALTAVAARAATDGVRRTRARLRTAMPVPPEPVPAAGAPLTPTFPPELQPEPHVAPQHTATVEEKPPRSRVPAFPRSRDGSFQQESLALEVPSGGFQLPPASLLSDLPAMRNKGRGEPEEVARMLEQTLASFGVEVKVVRWEQGPVVTRFEVQPAPGVRVQKISSLTNDIALALAAPSVRIEAPIPGKSAVGIELPNQKVALVHIKEILESEEYRRQTTPLTVALGKDIAGAPILGDLAEMPHLLIAGATGSGKSVMLNAIIAGLLFRSTPLDVRLLMIDPKRVEFTNYNNIPHLLAPVVTNSRAAAGALKEMLREMEERFGRFASSGVRNIQAYNAIPQGERLPYLVIIIDELADLMMVAPADFEDVICRLAQMTRATGIHMVLATQRPSVDVITGLIKANIPSRIAFAVSSQVDSRTILDMPGAEKLLGKGDMLYMPVAAPRPVRAQGAFIADSEIQALVTWWKAQGKPVYDQDVLAAEQTTAEGEGGEDALLAEAARIIVRAGYGSVSLLQRKMKIGYVRAARIVDQLEEKGIVGPAQGSNPRDLLVGVDEVEQLVRPSVR